MAFVTIRQFRATDRDGCRSLWAELVQHHRDIYGDPSIGGEKPGLEFDRHLDKVDLRHVWVAEVEGQLGGLTSLIVNGQEAEVEPVIVSSGCRGKGVGRELIARVVEEAKKLGVLCLSVKPVARNENAIAFFHQAGFRTLGHVQLFTWLGTPVPGQWEPGLTLFGRSFDY